MKIHKLLIILTLIFIYSCERYSDESREVVTKHIVLIDKTKIEIGSTSFYRGYTRFLMAFNDGTTAKVDFGTYSYFNIDDTVKVEKLKNGWKWRVIIE